MVFKLNSVWPQRGRAAIISLACLFACAPVFAQEQPVTVLWSASLPGTLITGEPDPIAGYTLYVGYQSRVYSSAIDVANVQQYVVTLPDATRQTYFALDAYSVGGQRSDLSSEVSLDPIPQPCVFGLVGGPGGVLGNAIATGELTLTASASTCTWTATSTADWLVVQPASGSGAATLTFTAAGNTVQAERTATVTVGGVPVTIQQAAAAPPPPLPADAIPPDVSVRIQRSGNSNNFTVTVASHASDAVRADVYVDDTRRVGTLSFVSPYMPKLVISVRGTHVIRAEVRDAAGNVGVATAIAIR